MQKLRFENFMVEYPSYKNKLLKHVYRYKDPNKLFIMKMLKKIPFFDQITKEQLHMIMYSMKEKFLFPGEYIAKKNTTAENFTLIMSGQANVVTEFEGNDFIMAKLYAGEITHINSFILDDFVHIDVQAITSM